ncbi:23S rRNA (-C5)-methyltransferase [Enterococcus moraviensis ATCC BAA-383]|uniref:23S rRNA (-C5)-methyltransferase n=1 Tax=Enterococcus moraviensis ATCC BAA-383 TaxID=1158609 RepID=R2QVP0_9ENTE|nr:class I SAM-dependent rRNA methyltransferase [Enterococcus moraviensis]EOI00565.1 23S rRNA (-C5)-methyltransferase [Enterococcus moraviensis ATCC BAA-383]EOT73206.1 23S rRNA (-C5)-methyltransferase [Enterococcus moraviensis ATCC BAA-383]OJG68762.1 23S rRNA (-C5)-methyltransferase [Enterococcus moraviensis]
MNIKVTKKSEKKFKGRYPLIQKEDLLEIPKSFSNEWVQFLDSRGQFIATGYLGEQNKGIGWLVNWQGKVDASFLENLFTQAKNHRISYNQDEATSAYRLFNGEGDGLGGLIIDRYDNFAVFSWYNETLYQKKEEIVRAFKLSFPEIDGAYEKIRFASNSLPESQKLYGNDAPEPLLVYENGVTYATYLNDGLMTGIFLDQKEVRRRLTEGIVAGKTVLNMFSYTGAFSVASAMGGSSTTTSVDLAKRSLPKTKEQFEVNHLAVEDQKIVVMDVFDYFKYAVRKALTYDVIVLDPPSFARNKKKVFSVAKNYGDLVKDSVDILAPEGLLIASTNAANISLEKYKKMIIDALEEKKVQYKFQEMYQLPSDFKTNKYFEEGNYLKVFFIKIKK